jgi:Na+/H+ antiporter NhaC
VTHATKSTLLALTIVLACATALPVACPAAWELAVHSEKQPLHGKSVQVTLQVRDENAQPYAGAARLDIDGDWTLDERAQSLDDVPLVFQEGKVELGPFHMIAGRGEFACILADGTRLESRIRAVHPLWALLPPLMAIALALWLRQVYLALAAGVLAGAWTIYGSPWAGFTHALQDIVVEAATDPFQGAILIFTATLGGMVGVMAKAGGTHGLVEAARHWIRGARSAQAATAVLGVLIFFDDYANTLLVGNTMRPVTDRMRVSREKLSYLVDCTAAPVATVAVLSTWVGYQVGLIGDGLSAIGKGDVSPYTLFVDSIPYSAYSWFALALVAWIVVTQRDFGPMLRAERRARETGAVLGPKARPLIDENAGDLDPAEGVPKRAHVAFLPVMTVLVGTVAGLYFDGRRSLVADKGVAILSTASVREIFSAADPAAALLWAVVLGASLAIALSVFERILDLQSSMDAFVAGAKAMVPALMILVLAWSIGDICERMGSANVVVDAATGNLSAHFVPAVTFLVAAFLGFSTGTSWGTMAILMPIVIPLAHALPESAGFSASLSNSILVSSVASVLSGSVLGDHCSPISDTTIMSSMASGSDHVDHVRTQLPYAGLAGTVAMVFGTIPAGFGVSPWITLPLGVIVLGVAVRLLGTNAQVALPRAGESSG